MEYIAFLKSENKSCHTFVFWKACPPGLDGRRKSQCDCPDSSARAPRPDTPYHTYVMDRYYSTTPNWIKLLSVPESPSPGHYRTAAVQV